MADNIKTQIITPDPVGTIEGMRDTGYDLDTALADIVDNSVDAEATEIDICDGTHSDGIQDAFWSTAVQDGPGTSVFKWAFERTGKTATTVTDSQLISAIYDERSKLKSDGNLHYFKNSTSAVQTSVKNRFTSEKTLALANNTNTLFNVSSTIV